MRLELPALDHTALPPPAEALARSTVVRAQSAPR